MAQSVPLVKVSELFQAHCNSETGLSWHRYGPPFAELEGGLVEDPSDGAGKVVTPVRCCRESGKG